jgi:hypothetical protein
MLLEQFAQISYIIHNLLSLISYLRTIDVNLLFIKEASKTTKIPVSFSLLLTEQLKNSQSRRKVKLNVYIFWDIAPCGLLL